MDRDYWRPDPAPRLVVEPGTVLLFEATEVRTSTFRVRVRLARFRDDLSGFYEGAVWLEGENIGSDGMPLGPVQHLVETAAIPDAVRRAEHGPRFD